ncbi:hypothetical protein Vretimale_12775 [Volvox reticuliferus]|uniref:Uncharacterized protein n=1 Tax=Volvox reticuliferus TaxID=1737510 RepID=A0A8J4FMF6_9CHLO|nr:hypothetical protein Vretifemale_10062 [Volvox reticuliferus]GIM08776.1 hypothetical protein Vretimale_12775 [Volvox reticuliferus]
MDLCNRLSPGGGRPGLAPRLRRTPSEMGDEPTVLSTEGSRMSLMGMQGGGGGGEGEVLTRSSSLAAMPGGGPSGDPLMTGFGVNMSGVRGRVVGWVPGPPGVLPAIWSPVFGPIQPLRWGWAPAVQGFWIS